MPTIHNLQNNASALALWARRIGIVDAPTSLNIVNYADVADNVSQGLTTSGNTFYLCPLTLATADGSLSMQLPVDPVISISGSNTIAQRQVAQSTMRGTIKEFWNADDYKVDIKSVLIGEFSHILTLFNAFQARIKKGKQCPETALTTPSRSPQTIIASPPSSHKQNTTNQPITPTQHIAKHTIQDHLQPQFNHHSTNP